MDMAMLSLFRTEVEQQSTTLNSSLESLEENPTASELLADAMRGAHSLKGAARLMGIDPIAQLAGAMEECFVAAQGHLIVLSPGAIRTLVGAVSMIGDITRAVEDLANWRIENGAVFENMVNAVKTILHEERSVPEKTSASGSLAVGPEKATDSSPPNDNNQNDAAVERKPSKKKADVSLAIQDMSMLELFRVEADRQAAVLSEGLLELEQDPSSAERLEPLMRASHSIKGAAKLLDIQFVVQLAHVMEDVFVAAQKGAVILGANQIDVLLCGVDTIVEISNYEGSLEQWMESSRENFDILIKNLSAILTGDRLIPLAVKDDPFAKGKGVVEPKAGVLPEIRTPDIERAPSVPGEVEKKQVSPRERILRVSAEQLNRLMGLAGESLVESRWIYPYAESLLRLKRQQTDLVCMVDMLRERLDGGGVSDEIRGLVRGAQKQASYCREILADRLAELESFDRRATNLSSRFHREVVKSRMRPFGDGIQGFPRMVRDIAKTLGKEVQLVVDGSSTMVDRDILDKVEAPMNHLLRNAIDHGLEFPEERAAAGKPAKGTIRLHAYHHAGMLSLVVEDDGRGVDRERLRRKVVEKGMVDQAMAATLSDQELLEFLFLPSFSTRDQVSEISGRGVGLDVVHDVVHEMRGSVKVASEFGKGTSFHMQLPLTLSVIPALIVEIAEEPYAFPLARIDRIVRIDPSSLKEAEGNQFIRIDERNVGLVNASQILECNYSRESNGGHLSVVVLSERSSCYGMVVDRFVCERDLVVQVMPSALGKVQDIAAAALMEDGSPVLIVDVDDLMRSIEKVLKAVRLNKINETVEEIGVVKRVLVVDDSITVREMERRLLESSGYQVDTAVDGMDGLNMLRSGKYDLLITDVDMPRMNGIELTKTVRLDPGLRSLPVMMVSYKDREEDKIRGLEAGADYYLTKGSFHDESLCQAVLDLIGSAKE